MDNFDKIYVSSKGQKFKIINYVNSVNIDIKFDDDTIVYGKHMSSIKSGKVTNPNFPSICKFGYIGLGKYTQTNNSKFYKIWASMLSRCYDNRVHKLYPKYTDCTVDEKWHNFQVFAEWCANNYTEGFVLDKDILVKGNKIYGPATCCFIPAEINLLFTKSEKTRGNCPIGVTETKNLQYCAKMNKFGKSINLGTFNTIERAFNMYKINKEFYYQQMANKFKNVLPEHVYKSIINYKIEITD